MKVLCVITNNPFWINYLNLRNYVTGLERVLGKENVIVIDDNHASMNLYIPSFDVAHNVKEYKAENNLLPEASLDNIIKEHKIDIVFVFSLFFLRRPDYRQQFRNCKAITCYLILYSGKKPQEIEKCDADLILTPYADEDEIRRVVPEQKILRLPFCVDTEIFKDYKQKKTYDVAFIGRLDDYGRGKRKKGLERISTMKGIKIKISPLIPIVECAKLQNSAKIVFSRTRPAHQEGGKQFTPKFFEIPATRTLFLTDKPKNFEDYFIDRQDMVIYKDDFSNLEELIYHYLGEDKERNRITDSGYQKVRAQHSCEVRARELIESVNKLL